VHGAGHGAWCWFKLAYLLRGSGHRVSCIDLAGAAGSLVDPDDVRSFDEYDAPLIDFMAAVPDGHKVSDEVYMQIVITYCIRCGSLHCIKFMPSTIQFRLLTASHKEKGKKGAHSAYDRIKREQIGAITTSTHKTSV
jgi:hypothetical protein